MHKTGRGVLYIVWGRDEFTTLLDRSVASVKRWHPELSIHVERLGDDATLLDKARMDEITPFQDTLYLDVDTVVMDRLDYGFARAEQFGMACAICEAPYAARYPGLANACGGDLVEFNTGVLFWRHGENVIFNRSADFFRKWQEFNASLDSSITWHEHGEWSKMLCNDQAGFTAAMHCMAKNPYVLPQNWNLRVQWQTSWFGKVKVWHAYWAPPDELVKNNAKAAPMTRRVGRVPGDAHGVTARSAT